jgi:hypothetical protein
MSTNLRPKLVGLVATVALFAIPVAGSLPASASVTHRVPPRLTGQWARPWSGGTEHLMLYGSRFRFFYDRYVRFAAHGLVSARDHRITFYASNQCTGTGTYEWSLKKGALKFVQAPGSSDPCPREPIVTSGTWRRH